MNCGSTLKRESTLTRGFTLIELMVAVTILVVLVALVYESFVSVTTTTDVARTEAARLRERQYLWRSFSENMGAIYSDPNGSTPEYALVGEDGSGAAGPGDTITFCTSLPMPGSNGLPGELRGVTYEVIAPQDADAATPTAGFSADVAALEEAPAYLLISEFPVVRSGGSDGVNVDDAKEEEQIRTHQVPITSMNILYYDSETEDWVDDWDSSENQTLPWAIEVMITLARTADEEATLGANPEEPDLDMTFVLPLGVGTKEPFLDPNHYYAGPDGVDPDSIFKEDPGDQAKKRKK